MANETDPLINRLSGSDPQNLFEYILRQKIYDSRFWKETCFGMDVADVLEQATKLTFVGPLPGQILALLLKLLQLHPEHDIIQKGFIEQEKFKYVRFLGCVYVRMTSRPVEIYETLESVYSDYRKIRVWEPPMWKISRFDELLHEILKGQSTNALGIALPRLVPRSALQEEGYLPEGRRPTALPLDESHENPMIEYLKGLALGQSALAKSALVRRNIALPEPPVETATAATAANNDDDHVAEQISNEELQKKQDKKKKKKKRKGERNYDNLFKSSSKKKRKEEAPKKEKVDEHSEEYWNEQRAKLGLGKLK